MKDRPRTQDFDWALLAIVAAISTIGVLEIYSSTHAAANMAGLQWRQLTWIGIGVAGMFLISRIDYHTLDGPGPGALHVRPGDSARRAGHWPFAASAPGDGWLWGAA